MLTDSAFGISRIENRIGAWIAARIPHCADVSCQIAVARPILPGD